MKIWKIVFSPEASKSISTLHPEIKRIVKQSLSELRNIPYSGKDLQVELSGFKSFRIKNFRIIYDIDENLNTIRIYYFGRRKDAYEQFRKLLMNYSDTDKHG